MPGDRSAEDVLHAKYLDWCSARIADLFLRLTPDEVYEIAFEAGGEPGGEPAASVVGGRVAEAAASRLSYRSMVERVTERLWTTLPRFEAWRTAYEREPERYEAELLGFWREA